MFDLISIGDTVIDMFVPLEDAQVFIRDGKRILGLRLGDKIPVGAAVSTIGGNAANNAVACARFKMKVALYANIGGDEEAEKTKKKLQEENVDLSYIKEHKELNSNHHIVLNFEGERTILTHHQAWDYKLPDLDKAKWVYFTSLAPSFPKTGIVSELTQYLERTGAKLAFNPGTFQIKYGIKKYPRLLSLVELFVVNKEEAKRILGHDEGAKIPPKKLLKSLADLGPKMVVITDGAAGSFGFDGEKYFQLDSFPAKVLQNTGAGDAFSSGVLAGLFFGKDLSEAMRWGAANGAAVVEKMGPQEGLLTYNQIMEKLKEHSKIATKEF